MSRILILMSLNMIFALSVSFPAMAQYTPGGFFSYARQGNIEGLKKALTKNPHQFLKDNALEAAVIGRQPDAIRLLVENGSSVNYINPDGSALLVNAIMLESYDEASLLLELGADPNIAGYYRLYHGYTMKWQWTPLMAACYKGNLELAKLLIAKGANVKEEGYSISEDELETAADIAAYSGHLDILKLILKNDVKLDEKTIFKAARGGHTDVVHFLLRKGYEIDAPGPNQNKTLLMEAAWWGHLELVKALIKSGADIHATDRNGYTALSEAAANGGQEFPHQLDIIKFLVKKGADVRAADEFKLTPLMRAKDPKVIEFLVEAGAR